jgi:hypothetical protein
MQHQRRAIARWARSPHLNLAAGLILVGTSLFEIAERLIDPVVLHLIGLDLDIGVEHGALTIGLLHVLRALPDVLEGVDRMTESEDEALVLAAAEEELIREGRAS